MLHSNKKAVSELVGYVLLIAIAISISIMVYSFLRVYVPKEKIECNEDINLIIQDYGCSVQNKKLNITLENKGLFKVDAVYLRFGNSSQKVKQQINKDNFLLYNTDNILGLNPGEISFSTYTTDIITSSGQYELELQPVIIKDKQLIVCEKAILFQQIQCN